MGRYTYDIFEPTADPMDNQRRFTEDFMPLHIASWKERKQKIYGKPYDFNAPAFVSMWIEKHLKIFLAYDGAKAVGFIVGIIFRPMEYNSRIFQIDDWYAGGNPTVRDGLFDYMDSAVRILGCDEIWLMHDTKEQNADLGPSWKVGNEFRQTRYVKR